ncbi:MAG: glycosyltransferase [bacterium]|nr:glycosyltransferase [bacterium]
MKPDITFSIITPSYNMLEYLECCAASITDQQNTVLEHIVVDGLSTDGTAEWLKERKGIKSIIEKDSGMYDAVNKGLRRAKGGILAYLNCDEQYLPGTLDFVKRYFAIHPEIDIIFGDMLLTRADGSLAAYRKSHQPRWVYILASHLYVASCTMFFRRKVFDEGLCFDLNYKANADADFVVRVLRKGFKVKHVAKYLSAFTLTGQNLSNDEIAHEEAARMLAQTPPQVRLTRPLLNLMRLGEKYLNGCYLQKSPLEYSIYVKGDPSTRKEFSIKEPSYKWQWM